ncbi:HNH/ENDO VII family nuclease [Clostridium perfringens]|uniref:HNH/ENDO VII family nuclease n=1 Tax=Clostridium perfringens TaxID=1502 RepID=UPI001FABE4DF|nr:HNH/ENDO VII family nuclease [Clostridium perfringens]
MANNIIPNVSSGDLVGSTPTFPPNAVVRGDFLYLRDVDGNQIPGRTVSDGDEITVLFISNEKNIVLVQYPTSSGYRQGYVTNATSIIKYKDDYSWVNGSTPEPVYDFDKTTQIGTLDPRERAVVLYKVDGMTYVAYDTGKGKLTKSGLVHYEGAGSSTGGGSFNGVAPGEVVPGGFTYENNAEVVGDELYLRDANGSLIPGRSVSVGDRITVLDVSYSKQLALVQYPAGSVVRQGYVTNATNLIRYFKQGEWLNGSTTEPVLDENGGSLGSLSPYEAATPLYKKNGMIHVVYDTSKGPNTKSGYVKFEGLAQLPDTSIQIPSVSHSQATVDVYGTSGKGRPLKVYKIGNGSKVLFAGFAIHGWEDRWDNDGLALVNIANSLISKIGDYKAQNGLHGWTVYIAPCMNPDGVIVRGTNNGPGRCAVKSRIDMNRCFPRGFKAQYNSRNYTGPNPLGAQEAVALKEFIEKINRTADELVVIDGHGWLGCTYGDSSIAQYFTKQFGFSHNGPSGGGYFSYWAQGLPRTRGLLLEYPDTYSYGEVISRNYIGKTFNAIINILKNNPNGSDVDTNTDLNYDKWVNKDGKWYYYENGKMVTGWKLVDGEWYYLGSDGVMVTGWIELGGIWYYLSDSGAMVKGWQTISGKTYYFNDSGHMLVGKQVIDGRNYNFNTSGQLDSTNWVKSNNKWYYYENGKMITGWKLINGEWYYLESNGVMATGWKELGGIWYYLNESGAMVKGWQTISGKTYYFNDSGHMLTGKQVIDGKNYEFNGSGQLISDTGDISSSEVTYIAVGKVINVQSFLNVRKGPGTEYDSIGQLYQGNKVSIVAKDRDWYKIKYDSDYGFVNKKFINILVSSEENIKDNDVEEKKNLNVTPDKLFKTITMNKNGFDIEYEWKLMDHDNRYHLSPVANYDNYVALKRASAIQLTPKDLLSLLISFSPIDAAKDFLDFVCGKDIITGDKINRGALFACIFLPGVADNLVKYGVKNSDELADVFKNIKVYEKQAAEFIGDARKYWTKVDTFKGIKVYQRDDLINPNLIDSKGRTNLERMLNDGIAPLDSNGDSINLHHMIQTNDSAIAEVTKKFHQQNTKTIHINPNTIPSGINRNTFDSWKRAYWKNRAKDFM